LKPRKAEKRLPIGGSLATARAGRTVCDLRSVDPADDPVVAEALIAALAADLPGVAGGTAGVAGGTAGPGVAGGTAGPGVAP
jgi:hypothetical protein